FLYFFFCSSRRRHTRSKRDWSSDVCSSDLRSAHVWELAPGCRLTQGSHDEVIVDPNTQNILTIVSADHNIATANGRWVVIPHGTIGSASCSETEKHGASASAQTAQGHDRRQ